MVKVKAETELNLNKQGKLSEQQKETLRGSVKVPSIIFLTLGVFSVIIAVLSFITPLISNPSDYDSEKEFQARWRIPIFNLIIFSLLGIYLITWGIQDILAKPEVSLLNVKSVEGVPIYGGSIHWRVYGGAYMPIFNPKYTIGEKDYSVLPSYLLEELEAGTKIKGYYVEWSKYHGINLFSGEKRRIIINYEKTG